jgi:hypothetical protein
VEYVTSYVSTGVRIAEGSTGQKTRDSNMGPREDKTTNSVEAK